MAKRILPSVAELRDFCKQWHGVKVSSIAKNWSGGGQITRRFDIQIQPYALIGGKELSKIMKKTFKNDVYDWHSACDQFPGYINSYIDTRD